MYLQEKGTTRAQGPNFIELLLRQKMLLNIFLLYKYVISQQ